MSNFMFLIVLSLLMGACGLAAFLWALNNGQYEDIAGDSERILPHEPSEDRSEGRG